MKKNTIILLWLLLGAVLVYKTKVNGLDWLKETVKVLIEVPSEEVESE